MANASAAASTGVTASAGSAVAEPGATGSGSVHAQAAAAGAMDASHPAPAWTPVCSVEDIPRAGARVVKRGGADDIAVFRASDDHVFALLDRCPHKGGPLSAGLVHGHAVTCPLHGWIIGLDDGQAQAPDEGCSQRIAARVEGGTVYLDLAGRGHGCSQGQGPRPNPKLRTAQPAAGDSP